MLFWWEYAKKSYKKFRRILRIFGSHNEMVRRRSFYTPKRFPETKYQNQGWDFPGELRENVDSKIQMLSGIAAKENSSTRL